MRAAPSGLPPQPGQGSQEITVRVMVGHWRQHSWMGGLSTGCVSSGAYIYMYIYMYIYDIYMYIYTYISIYVYVHIIYIYLIENLTFQ